MYKTKSNLKPEIYHIIRNDISLRMKISKQLGVTESSVYKYAFRKSPTLSKPIVIDVIKEHTKKKESEIIDKT